MGQQDSDSPAAELADAAPEALAIAGTVALAAVGVTDPAAFGAVAGVVGVRRAERWHTRRDRRRTGAKNDD